MDTTTQTAEQAMRDALDSGMRSVDACYAIRKSHGLSFDQLADLYHIVKTGQPTPEWAKSGTTESIMDPGGERAVWERSGEPR